MVCYTGFDEGCCGPTFDDCEETLVDFNDETFGSLPNTGDATPPSPWSLTDVDHPGQLVYSGSSDGEVLWTVPVVDLDIRTKFRVQVYIDTDGLTDSDAGGATIAGSDWQAWFGVEQGDLILRYLDSDGQTKSVIAATNFGAFDTTLTLTAEAAFACRGWTRLTGVAGTGETTSFFIRKDIEVASFPNSIDMGLYAPPDSSGVSGDSPFPDICPVGDICHNGMTVTGEFHDGTCGCSPSTEAAGFSTSSLVCSGTPLSSLLTGFVPADGYWIAPLPFAEFFGAWTGWKTLLWYDAGNDVLRSVVIDSGNCPQWTGASPSVSCDPFSVAFDLSEPVISCCMDSIGQATITWASGITACPSTPRIYDNVVLSACAGLLPTECSATYTDCDDDPDNLLPVTLSIIVEDMPESMLCYNGSFYLTMQGYRGRYEHGPEYGITNCGGAGCATDWHAINEEMPLGMDTTNGGSAGRMLYNALHFASLETCERDESEPGIAYDAPEGSCFSDVYRIGWVIRESVPSSGVFDTRVFQLHVGTSGIMYESQDFPYPNVSAVNSMTFTKLGSAPADWPTTIIATASPNLP